MALWKAGKQLHTPKPDNPESKTPHQNPSPLKSFDIIIMIYDWIEDIGF